MALSNAAVRYIGFNYACAWVLILYSDSYKRYFLTSYHFTVKPISTSDQQKIFISKLKVNNIF